MRSRFIMQAPWVTIPQQVNIQAIMERDARWNENTKCRAQSNTHQSCMEHVQYQWCATRVLRRGLNKAWLLMYTQETVYTDLLRESAVCPVNCNYILHIILIYIYKKRFHNVISIKMLFICYKFQSTCTRQCVAICIFNLIFILLGHLFILTQLIGSSLPEVTAGYATWIHLRCVWKLWNSYRVDLDVRACGLNIGTTKRDGEWSRSSHCMFCLINQMCIYIYGIWQALLSGESDRNALSCTWKTCPYVSADRPAFKDADKLKHCLRTVNI